VQPLFLRGYQNLSGDGGSSKTEIILQLIAASVLQTQWFGKDVSPGPCLYYGAEDEFDELHIRLETIVRRAGRRLADLDGVRLISMAGLDAVLAEPDNKKNLNATAIYKKLVSRAIALRPKLIVIDPSADVFGGDEINRAQDRKFVSTLRPLALKSIARCCCRAILVLPVWYPVPVRLAARVGTTPFGVGSI
jgi:RecA-family ATPase